MTKLTPSMRLKVKRDTFFIPESNNSVFFRNNYSSFRMEGSSIYLWVEKLMPMFNGENTLSDLTKGLQDSYRDRVYEIADVLYQNKYVQDVSQDRPHQLSSQVLKRHASQIEFLDSFSDSGAYRFQTYRQTNVLAIGSGPIFVSLVSALIESGLPKLNVLITESVPTNRQRLVDLVEHASINDPDVELKEIILKNSGNSSKREIVQQFDSILYVSGEGDIEELRALHALCRNEKKMFLPAISLQKVGFAGPIVHPKSDGCWESAWRRLHQTALNNDKQYHSRSSTADALLSNVIVFELFKHVTRASDVDQSNQFFLLDFDTLEGKWHSFIPHPLVTGRISTNRVEEFDLRLRQGLSKDHQNELLLFFNQMTSIESGIFHIWDEEDLEQLPLAQCYVQAVDPLSDGPARLLPKLISSGLTHHDARRESGLAGIEAYATQVVNLLFNSHPQHQEVGSNVELNKFIGVGAGETFEESVSRGLQRCLEEELNKQLPEKYFSATPLKLSTVEDKRCLFYLKALTTLQGVPNIALGEEVAGFPVVWLCTKGLWYGSVGLNVTMALRNVLQHAIMKSQNPNTILTTRTLEVTSLLLEKRGPISIEIPSYEDTAQFGVLQTALEVLKGNRKQLLVYELQLEPFLQEKLAGVFGVLLREEESL
jgi:putative thiazole-containing bacteriocin maturation protein